MGRNLIGSCGLLIAIGLGYQPLRAGDHKSAGRAQAVKEVILVTQDTYAMSRRYEKVGASSVRLFEAGYSASTNRHLDQESARENAPAPTGEHQRLTLFHLHSKFGDIAVQPVIGHVNGAQLSIGF